MSTHNICICREIRKILCGYPLLSVAIAPDKRSIQLNILFISPWIHKLWVLIRSASLSTYVFIEKSTLSVKESGAMESSSENYGHHSRGRIVMKNLVIITG